MSKSRTIGVRFKGTLLADIEQHEMNNCMLIRMVMQQHFADDGNRAMVSNFANNDGTINSKNVNDANNSYNGSLMELLTNQHILLTEQLNTLQKRNKKLENQVEYYHVLDLPFWKRRRYHKEMKLLPAVDDKDIVDLK
ncbi:hypothetical protein KKH23_04500 [Patescibacteria group bacterium]|nr:hypothetical protein [Patescibacteria group bacterium]